MTLTAFFFFRHSVEQHMKKMICFIVELDHHVTLYSFYHYGWDKSSPFRQIYQKVSYLMLNHCLNFFRVNLMVWNHII